MRQSSETLVKSQESDKSTLRGCQSLYEAHVLHEL